MNVPILSSYLSAEVYILSIKKAKKSETPLYPSPQLLETTYSKVENLMIYRQNRDIAYPYSLVIETKLFGDVVPIIKGKIILIIFS